MEGPDHEDGEKRPHAVLRALLTLWLVVWAITIAFFLRAQFDPLPLLSWPWAAVWLAVSVGGWILIYRLLNKLRQMPPE